MDDRYVVADVAGKHACLGGVASKPKYFDDGQIEFIDELALTHWI